MEISVITNKNLTLSLHGWKAKADRKLVAWFLFSFKNWANVWALVMRSECWECLDFGANFLLRTVSSNYFCKKLAVDNNTPLPVFLSFKEETKQPRWLIKKLAGVAIFIKQFSLNNLQTIHLSSFFPPRDYVFVFMNIWTSFDPKRTTIVPSRPNPGEKQLMGEWKQIYLINYVARRLINGSI